MPRYLIHVETATNGALYKQEITCDNDEQAEVLAQEYIGLVVTKSVMRLDDLDPATDGQEAFSYLWDHRKFLSTDDFSTVEKAIVKLVDELLAAKKIKI